MSLGRDLLMRMFGCPHGLLGRLGGHIMARTNENCGAWAIDLLDIRCDDCVLEVGFGPGVIVGRLSALTTHVAGVDQSCEMIAQARARNAKAIERGGVALYLAPAHSLPFEAGTFDKALAINSMQVLPDPVAGLREMCRVMKPDGTRSRSPLPGIPVNATRACLSNLPPRASSTLGS
jgi:ubiquinone/menaquinone biosynthesis C-methylase UbiE